MRQAALTARGPSEIGFFVPGIPVPGGSKRGFVVKGKAVLVDTSGRRGKNWRVSVQAAAQTAYDGGEPLRGPLRLEVTFSMRRPKAHYRTNGRLKDSAPLWALVRPDATKLLRALEDALTGILWVDDAQIVKQHVEKIYGPRPGADVRVYAL
jgi:Holliday junction resolvase RusA-like endonuclease